MTQTNFYYTPPSDEAFDEVKEKATELWSTMGNEPSYSEGKINRIKNLNNVKDNFMYMIAMFSIDNQIKLADKLSIETIVAIRERLKAGGSTFIVF